MRELCIRGSGLQFIYDQTGRTFKKLQKATNQVSFQGPWDSITGFNSIGGGDFGILYCTLHHPSHLQASIRFNWYPLEPWTEYGLVSAGQDTNGIGDIRNRILGISRPSMHRLQIMTSPFGQSRGRDHSKIGFKTILSIGASHIYSMVKYVFQTNCWMVLHYPVLRTGQIAQRQWSNSQGTRNRCVLVDRYSFTNMNKATSTLILETTKLLYVSKTDKDLTILERW